MRTHRTFIATYMMGSGRNGTIYTGMTSNLFSRVWKHKNGTYDDGYTAEHGCDQLVWYETHQYIDQAIIREKRIKRWLREWKFALVEKDNPRWLDLYGEVRLRHGPGSAEPTGPEI